MYSSNEHSLEIVHGTRYGPTNIDRGKDLPQELLKAGLRKCLEMLFEGGYAVNKH